MERELNLLSWNEVEMGARNILKELKEKQIHIDTIIPVLRGGAPLRKFIK